MAINQLDVEKLAELFYESLEMKRPWGHPETRRIWRKRMLSYAMIALSFVEGKKR